MRTRFRIVCPLIAGALLANLLAQEAVDAPQPRPGTLVSWSAGGGGGGGILCVIPPDLYNVQSVAVAAVHALALHYDGSVSAWGSRTNVPGGLADVAEVAASDSHNAALLRDGRVITWTWTTSATVVDAIAVPNELPALKAIAAGGNFTMGLAENGDVLAWPEPAPNEATNAISIAAGASHAVALRRDGTVVAWGANSSGQATVPPGLSNVMLIDACADVSAALTSDGMLHTWGRPARLLPERVMSVGTNFVDMALTRWGVVLLDPQGKAVCFGHDPLPELEGAASIEAGSETVVAVVPAGLLKPIITRDRASGHHQRVPGESLYFFSNAAGTGELQFQWLLDGVALPGQTSTNLVLTRLKENDGGTYTLQVTDRNGSAFLNPAVVEIVQSRFLQSLPPRNARIDFRVNPAKSFRVQASGNLLDWFDLTAPIQSFSNDPGKHYLTDTGIGETAQRFYRIITE